MVGYKIYLTKSSEVAFLLSKGNDDKRGKDNVCATSAGEVLNDCRIPELYHDKGWFYALIEYRSLERPKYEIVFA